MAEQMIQYAIYDRPADFPEAFVVRGWGVTDEGEPRPMTNAILFGSLDEARAWIPKGMVCLARMDGDDPCIVEVWV